MPQDKEKLASPSNCKIPSGVQLPPSSRPEAKPQPRPKAPAISARSRVSWHTVNLRSAHLAQSSEHPNTFRLFAAPTLECSDVRLGSQETRERVLELRRRVTVPREIRSLGRRTTTGRISKSFSNAATWFLVIGPRLREAAAPPAPMLSACGPPERPKR